jgi:3',5'-nucleoside bisphosphate phosphatase
MCLVFGYEFSCDSNVDDVHIIGYELDWNDPCLLEAQEYSKKSKSGAYKELCELLTKRGLGVDYEKEILNYRDKKGNICKRTPDDVQRKHIFELLAARGYFASWEEAKIFIRNDPALNIKRKKINPVYAIEIIRKCGGLSVLAHPYLIDEYLYSADIKAHDRKTYIDDLIISGLDGIESCYTYSKTTYRGGLADNQIKKEIEETYFGRVKFFTGGSDYHNDSKKGAANPREIGEAGMGFGQFRKIFSIYFS